MGMCPNDFVGDGVNSLAIFTESKNVSMPQCSEEHSTDQKYKERTKRKKSDYSKYASQTYLGGVKGNRHR